MTESTTGGDVTGSGEKEAPFWVNWNAQMLDRYRTRLDKGEHDHDCEQRERYGLCDCRKRKRLTEGRTELPTLWQQNPLCSGCMGEVTYDGDEWRCYKCHVSWGLNDYDQQGEWDDDTGTHEASTFENYGERMIVLATTPPASPDGSDK